MGEQGFKAIWKEGSFFEKGHWKIIPDEKPDSGAALVGWLIAIAIIFVIVALLLLTLPIWITLIGFNLIREKRYYAGIGVVLAIIYFWLDIQNGWLTSYLFFGYYDEENLLKESLFNIKYFKIITIFNLMSLVIGLGYILDSIIIAKYGKKHDDGTVTKYQVLAYSLPIILVLPFYLTNNFEKTPNLIPESEITANVETITNLNNEIEQEVIIPSINEELVEYDIVNEGINENDIVKIGEQEWCTKNLSVNTYRNGDIIPQVQNPEAWKNLKTGAWCYISEDTNYGKIYGKLYNWYAVTDPRGLAPEGYLIPTKEDWLVLIEYLGGRNSAGQKMKSKSNWLVGDNSYPTNYSSFSGLPAGARGQEEPTWNKVGEFTRYWSANIDAEGDYYFIGLSEYDQVGWYYASGNYKNYGFSVRCIKGDENEISDEFYIISTSITKNEEEAKNRALKLNNEGYKSSYLWIPDYNSLSKDEYFCVYIGPIENQIECEKQVEEYRKVNPKTYGILVSQENKRIQINGLNQIEITAPYHSPPNNENELKNLKIIRDSNRGKGQANVFWNRKYTLFDFATDEPISPEVVNGEAIYKIYYSSNEDPKPHYGEFDIDQLEKHIFYKFKNKENCLIFCNQKNNH